jgi:hypothetical protein
LELVQLDRQKEVQAMSAQINAMQSQIQSLMSAFSNMQEQPQVDSMAKTLYSSGILVKAENKEEQELIKAAGKAVYNVTRTITSASYNHNVIFLHPSIFFTDK